MFQRFDIHSRIVKRSGITFYGAQDKLLGREVWLWRLFEFGDMERSADEQLKAEKAPLVALRHPGIVSLLDIEADPDGIVALLEPVPGETLDEWMTRGPVDVHDFNQIAESCLVALSASAAAGVPHGALEPGLIFVSKSADVRVNTSLVGFGIARLVMRLHGGEHETSEALDVWMLGGILHALLTGEHIEEGRAIRPPHELRPEIPAPVSEWVMRLLVDDANVRPQTATDALALLRHALAPAPAGPAAGYFLPMQWPAGYDPNLHQPPMWHYPQVPVWHLPPQQWTQPYDPALAAQQQQMWQQVPWYPWPGQMPHDPYQQQQLAAQQPAPPVAEVNPNTPKPRLPAPPKSAIPAAAPEKPKVSLKKWIGPAISLAAAAGVVWFFRDVFAPVFRRETWQGMLGDNVTIKWPGGSPPPAAPVPVVAAAPVAPAPATPVAPPRARPKSAAPKPPPTGPIFVKKFSVPAQKNDPAFTAGNGGKFTLEATPATWSGSQIAGRLTAEKPFAMLTTPLPKDVRLLLKKGKGIELRFDVHIDGTPSASPRGFRFGLFAAKKGGYFAVVPVGGPGELAILASASGGKNSASDTDSQEFKSTGNRATPGLVSGKVVRCTLTIRISADDKLQIDAKADDAAATVIINPKTDPRTDNFNGGLLILRNGDNLGGFYFDNVTVEALPPKP